MEYNANRAFALRSRGECTLFCEVLHRLDSEGSRKQKITRSDLHLDTPECNGLPFEQINEHMPSIHAVC